MFGNFMQSTRSCSVRVKCNVITCSLFAHFEFSVWANTNEHQCSLYTYPSSFIPGLDAAMLPPLLSISDTFPSYLFVGEKNIEEQHE